MIVFSGSSHGGITLLGKTGQPTPILSSTLKTEASPTAVIKTPTCELSSYTYILFVLFKLQLILTTNCFLNLRTSTKDFCYIISNS